MFPFIRSSIIGKTNLGEKRIRIVVASRGVQVVRQILTWKGHEGTFWGVDNVLYLGKSLGYLGVCICQNL